MLFKNAPHSIFDYTPMFFKPEEDTEVKESLGSEDKLK